MFDGIQCFDLITATSFATQKHSYSWARIWKVWSYGANKRRGQIKCNCSSCQFYSLVRLTRISEAGNKVHTKRGNRCESAKSLQFCCSSFKLWTKLNIFCVATHERTVMVAGCRLYPASRWNLSAHCLCSTCTQWEWTVSKMPRRKRAGIGWNCNCQFEQSSVSRLRVDFNEWRNFYKSPTAAVINIVAFCIEYCWRTCIPNWLTIHLFIYRYFRF